MPPFIVSQSTNWWELSVLADNIAEDEKQNNPPDEIQKGLDTQIWGMVQMELHSQRNRNFICKYDDSTADLDFPAKPPFPLSQGDALCGNETHMF